MTNPQNPNDALRGALAKAYVAGATAVHNEWTRAEDAGESGPPGDPEFGEAAGDYAYAVLEALAQSQEPASSPSETLAQKQAREVMNPGFGSAMSALDGQAYNAPAPSPVAQDKRGSRSRLSVLAAGKTIADAYHPSTFSNPVGAFWNDVDALSPSADEEVARLKAELRAAKALADDHFRNAQSLAKKLAALSAAGEKG